MDATYLASVRLLIDAIPIVFEEPLFAMKGGTALNLFVQDLPRLSVDIDVVFTDHAMPRSNALSRISEALDTARQRLARQGLSAAVASTKHGDEIKLFVRRGQHQVKVEVNHVFRGTILPAQVRRLSPETRRMFTTDTEARVLAVPELYAGKIVAALDRQHPRDLFDIHRLYESGGLTPMIVECFVCYLTGHNRPLHEVLFSRDKDLAPAFGSEFSGMARSPASLDTLIDIRRRLRADLQAMLTRNHREFLLSLVRGSPDWDLMQCRHLSDLPAIRWKLENLARLKKSTPRKFAAQEEALQAGLGEPRG